VVAGVITAAPGEIFAAEVTNFPADLGAGVVGVQLIHVETALVIGTRSTDVVETPADSGSYIATPTAPALAGTYTIFWDWCDGGALIPSRTASEELVVQIVGSGSATMQPLPAAAAAAAVTVPHFAMPFAFRAGAAVVCEQDSIEEIGDAVANICRYTIGDRPEKPTFGTPPLLFVEGGPDPGLLAATVASQEPRAVLAAAADGSQLEELVVAIAITVTDKGAAG
jgi:hypothetical protein